MSSSHQRGEMVEQAALTFLQGRGLNLLERNYRCRAGELDLIMREGDTLVFVEVRYRASDRFGTGAESIDRHKQRRLIHAAEHYLVQSAHSAKRARMNCRFDVISATGTTQDNDFRNLTLSWIRDAFESDG